MKEMLVKIAKNTGRLLLENFGRADRARPLRIKSAWDFSIVADVIAERSILKKLREGGIKCKVLTEESGQIDLGDSGQLLIIDPLDGTLNYSNGIPHFCVSLALQKGAQVELGVVYDPCRKELFLAERGKGAFLNARRIVVNKGRDLKSSFCAIAFDYKDFKRGMEVEERLRKAVRRVRVFGCAGLDFCWVACGRLQGYVDLSLAPWDIAAGALIVEEAGGKVTDLNGNRWNPYCRQIVASNGIAHEELLKAIK